MSELLNSGLVGNAYKDMNSNAHIYKSWKNSGLIEGVDKDIGMKLALCLELTAVTNFIRDAIENKTYRTYSGGGFYKNGDIVNKYDVVVWFTWGGDPEFMVCDDHDGDHCDLVGCSTGGILTTKAK